MREPTRFRFCERRGHGMPVKVRNGISIVLHEQVARSRLNPCLTRMRCTAMSWRCAGIVYAGTSQPRVRNRSPGRTA